MFVLSKLHFKLLSSQRDFFQVESIQNYRCRCTAGRLPLFCLLGRYHSIDHINRIQRFFRKAYRTLVVSVVKDFSVILGEGEGGHQLYICGQRRQYVRLLLSCSIMVTFPTDSLLIKVWWENKFSRREIVLPVYILIWNLALNEKCMFCAVKGRNIMRWFVNRSRRADNAVYLFCKMYGNPIMEKGCIEHYCHW